MREGFKIQTVPEFETGQMLGRAVYRPLWENDSLLNAWADRHIPVPFSVVQDYVGTETSIDIWTGWVLVTDGHESLKYYIAVTSGDSDHPSTVALTFDGDPVDDVEGDETAVEKTASGTFDVSGYAPGLYQIVATMSRDGGDTAFNATGYCRPPYLTYDGSAAYSVPATMIDGKIPTAAKLNVFRSNDAWFGAQMEPNHGCASIARKYAEVDSH